MTVKITPGYRPMRNDAAGFDPMGDDWAYILDDAPPDTWRELVATCDRRETWPFQVRGASRHGDGYFYARLSPDWCFLAWGRQYVGACWDPARPHEVACRVIAGRLAGQREGEHAVHDWAAVVTLDLHEQTFTWHPCPRDARLGVPDDVAAEIEHKAGKLLAFFNSAIEHWRAGDQPRPVVAADLYTSPEGPRS
jgi:hypothetical protein